MAGEIPNLNIQVTIDSSGVSAGVSKVTSGLKSIEEQTKTTEGALSNFRQIAVGVFGGNLLTQGLMETQKGLIDMVKAVTDAQAATAKLATAMNNAKQNTEANRAVIEKTSHAMASLGFETADTEQAYGNLVTSTGSVAEATKLMSMAADLARYKHESLATAATTLARGTQGSVKAFKELGITLDTTLPKNEAIAKAFDQLNAKIGGQASAYADTFSGKLEIMKAKLNDLTVSVGSALLPVLSNLMSIVMSVGAEIGKLYDSYIKPLTNFIKENAAAFETLITVLGGAYAAFKTYEIGMNLFKAAQIVYIAMTAGMTAAQTALTFATEAGAEATKAMTVVQAALNAVMDANPIGLVVVAIAALAAAFVIAWNHSKTFRDIIIDVAKAGVEGFGWLVQIMGDIVVAIMKINTGPLKLLLEGLSFMPGIGGAAKTALNDIKTATSDVGNFFDSTATSITNMGKSLDSLKNKKIDLSGILGGGAKATTLANAGDTSVGGVSGVAGNVVGGNTTKGAAASASKEIAQLATDSKQVNSIYASMTTALKDYSNTYETLQNDKNKRDLAAQDTFDKASAAATDTYYNALVTTQAAFNATSTKAQEVFASAKLKIDDTYEASALAALNTYNSTVEKTTDANNAAILKLNTDAADKQLALVEKSESELTNAFNKATTVDLAKSFTGYGTATGLVTSLQSQLDAMNKLAADAAKLGGQGYSQQFIQQVVAQGPLLGDQMAQALIEAQPGTTAQIQNLFAQVQDVSANGLNGLADSLNKNGVLADTSLQAQYNQIGTDLTASLATQQSTFNDALTAATTTYNDAINKATTTQQDALAAAQTTLDQAIADATSKLQDAQANAKTAMDDTLTKANTALQDALTASQTAFDQATTTLHDSTMTKLNDLQTKLQAVAKLMSSLGVSGQASAYLATNGSIATPYISGNTALPTTSTTATTTPAITVNQTNNINGSTAPSDITSATINGILYGTPQILTTTSGGKGMVAL
jgi:hypothetical protein